MFKHPPIIIIAAGRVPDERFQMVSIQNAFGKCHHPGSIQCVKKFAVISFAKIVQRCFFWKIPYRVIGGQGGKTVGLGGK